MQVHDLHEGTARVAFRIAVCVVTGIIVIGNHHGLLPAKEGAKAIVSWAGGSDQRVHYVSQFGNDATHCTEARPCREIQRALSLARAGDVISIADGDYKGFTIEGMDGTAGRPLVIIAAGRNAAIMPTIDRPDNRDNIVVSRSSFVVIEGLRSERAPRAGLRIDRSTNVVVRRCQLGNNGTWGLFTSHSDSVLIEYNVAYLSGRQHGIYLSNSGDRPVVRGNSVRDNAGSGIQLNGDLSYGGDGLITGAIIENNAIYSNGRQGGAAVNLDGVQHAMIRNNILYDNHGSGIAMYRVDGAEGPVGNRIYHNTVDMAADGRYAIRVTHTAGVNTIRNNIIHNRNAERGAISVNTENDVANIDSDYNVFAGMVAVTPDDGRTRLTLEQWQARGRDLHSFRAMIDALFVRLGADYRLRAGAPAIGRGTRLVDVASDFDGRVFDGGNGVDIGAYRAP